MISKTELTQRLLLEGRDDHLGLWWVVSEVSGCMGDAPRQEVKKETLALIHELLSAGLVEAGFPSKDGRGFEPWPGTAPEVLERIRKEWEALDRDPSIGDVVWLNTTPKADSVSLG